MGQTSLASSACSEPVLEKNLGTFSIWHFVIVGAVLVVTFIPTIIAVRVDHQNKLVIFVLNLLAFTVVAWIVALIWALSNPKTKVQLVQAPVSDSAVIERLAELTEKGVLSEAEFTKIKTALTPQET
ncbi:superinfection immunity protein [Rhodovibrionaceae bacterium A322]